jgi:DNA mismatch repair ATPase MutS
VATHDLELVELLQDKNYAVYHFSEQILNDNLHFDYKIKSGKLETQNAIKILELYDYPKEITDEALSVKNTFFS